MSHAQHYFSGRRMVVATQHKKEVVMKPLLERSLGVHAFTLPNFNTDLFGTFTGEVERTGSAVDTLRRKIIAAMDLCGCDLGVGSEGSFGPHPQIPFLAADVECVMLIDRKHTLEILASHLTTDTNFKRETITLRDELNTFLQGAQFPSHGIIIINEKTRQTVKGITTWQKLEEVLDELRFETTLTVETDMRALYNPTRMEAIKHTTSLLIEKLTSACTECGTPGFTFADAVTGLPCELCGEPTDLVREKIKRCAHCGNTVSVVVASVAPAQYCNCCNP